jgi:hypothetical protein
MSEYMWKLLPYFLFRSTGFPYQLIERLAFQETIHILDELLNIEEEIEAARAELQDAIHTEEARYPGRALFRQMEAALQRKTALQQIHEPVPHLAEHLQSLIERWNILLTRYQQHEQRARAIFTQEMASRRRVLYNYALDSRFEEAIWLSSPQMYDHGLLPYLKQWNPDRRTSDTRRVERQLISYLQRFCVKNDTTSFFGPINYGDFVSSSAAIGLGAGHIQQRKTFMAYWGVAALAETIARDQAVRPYLRPRLHPLCQMDEINRCMRVGTRKAATLTSEQQRLLSSIDGSRTLMQIAEKSLLPIEEVLKQIDRLASQHIVIVQIEVPVTIPNALEWLVAWVHNLPTTCTTRERWFQVVNHCQVLQNQFTAAPLEERREILRQLEDWFAEIIRQPARREGGELYADRLLLYEECYGGIGTLSLGPDCLAELQSQLAPILDLYAAHACALHEELERKGVSTLLALSGNSAGTMPFLTYLQEQGKHVEPSLPTSSKWETALLEQVAEHADEHVVTVDMARLPAVDRTELSSSGLIASPDVMLITRDEASLRRGNFTTVMAECHDTLLIWGWGLYFHPSREKVEAAATGLLRGLVHEGECVNILPSKRAKIIPFEYPGPTIEMLASSEKAAGERIPIAAVETLVKKGHPFLRAPGHPLLRLYNGELSSFMHNIFALPRIRPLRVELPVHTPRILMGKAVFQREQWRFTREQLLPGKYTGACFELMYDIHRAARRAALPRYLFLRVPGERKPVFIDRYNYFLLELLHYLLPEHEEFILQEMLPTPDQLWLGNSCGTFCNELRLSVGYTAIGESDVYDQC